MKWLIGILSLIFLIIFHEFGHLIVSKLLGVKVESFSIGFGPILFHKKIKGTDYRLSLLPLGGYCSMKGDKDFQSAIDNNLPEIIADKDSLYGVHPLKRGLIGFAGPFFNFLFAVIAYTVINFIGYSYYTYSNKIIIPPVNELQVSPARDAGLISGDKIIKINKKNIIDFSDIVTEISTHPDENLEFIIERNSEFLTFSVHTLLNKENGTGKAGLSADVDSLYLRETDDYNFIQSLVKGLKDTLESIKLSFKSIFILFKGVNLKNTVSGPARITEIIGDTATKGFSSGVKTGIISFLDLMAIISISLFIMNLLPIPVLDGGLILISVIEFILRKKINPKLQYYIQFIGIALILILFFIGLTGDISYFINKD